MKKKIVSIMLLCALVCSAAACGDNKPAQSGSTTTTAASEAPASAASAADITAAVLAEVPINSAKDKDKDKLPDYFDGLDLDSIEDHSFYVCGSGAYPDELGVFRFKDEDSAAAAKSAAEKRIKDQLNDWSDYRPDECYKLEDAVAENSGVWLFYIVTSDNAKAKEIVKGIIK